MTVRCMFLALIALLFPASAFAQMYVYSSLYVHSNGADGYSYAVVPYGWIHSSTLRLFENGNQINYAYGQSHYNGQPVYLSVTYYGYPPPYTLYDQIAEVDGELSDYGWFWETQYSWGQTPPPSVTIGGDGDEWDGQSGHTFSLSVQGGTPSHYAWQYSYPPGAGNNPSVSFSGSGSSVSTDAHWFASPDGACSGRTPSQYAITGSASIANYWYQASTPYRIHIPNPGGEAYSPRVGGQVLLMPPAGGSGLWTVGQNQYLRTQPTVAVNALMGSQFRTKVEEHENVHLQQFTTGIFSANWNPVAAYDRVKNLTHVTFLGLDALVKAAVQAYNQEQDAAVQARMPDAEAQAYAVSDAIAPHYFYQSACGRH